MDIFLPPEISGPVWGYAVALLASVFIVGIAKGGFGGGIGMLCVPVMLQVLPARVALPLLLPILIACDLCTIRHFPHDWDKRGFVLIAPGMFAGLFVGLFCLDWMRSEDIKFFVGVLSLVFCFIMWSGLGDRPMFTNVSFGKGTLVGLACGISTMVAHSAGAIVNMFLLSRRLDKETFIGTTARFYFTFNVLKIPFFALNPAENGPTIGWNTLLWASWTLPLCPLAVWLGVWMQRRFSQETFRTIIYITLILIAGKLIWESVGFYLGGG